jgi:peptidoglycan/LPS O-acetylase OafA/YrhL
MDDVGQILSAVGSLGNLACFILVLLRMFQRGESGNANLYIFLVLCCGIGWLASFVKGWASATAIFYLLLVLCCGIGGLAAFLYAWSKHRDWGISKLMYVWTACWVLTLVGYTLTPINYQ